MRSWRRPGTAASNDGIANAAIQHRDCLRAAAPDPAVERNSFGWIAKSLACGKAGRNGMNSVLRGSRQRQLRRAHCADGQPRSTQFAFRPRSFQESKKVYATGFRVPQIISIERRSCAPRSGKGARKRGYRPETTESNRTERSHPSLTCQRGARAPDSTAKRLTPGSCRLCRM